MREEFRHGNCNRTRTSAASLHPPSSNSLATQRRIGGASELVAQQVETYISVGSMTQQQILDLQAQMAPLDAKTRTKVMSRLMKAVNSGDLDAQF